MNKLITESGMDFGPFNEECLYEIEKSKVIQKLKIKTTEFVVYYKKALIFLEAKSSSPKPDSKDEPECFDDYIDELTRKFRNSVGLFFSIQLGRYQDNMGIKLSQLILGNTTIKLILVIKDHDEEWLQPISDALKPKLYEVIKACNINPCNVIIINDEIAKEKGLIN